MYVDCSGLPNLAGTVGMINQWQDEKRGWECQVCHVFSDLPLSSKNDSSKVPEA